MPHEFSKVEDALEALTQGRVVIVVDDEGRENEGDFIAAADRVTPETIEFMITHGRGQLCMPIMPDLANRLELHPMVDLNTAPKELIANLFEVLGVEQQSATELADRIVGWRTPPKDGAANDEEALYLASGLAYSPRQGPFAHVNELSLVLGLSPAMAERWRANGFEPPK